MRHGVIFALNVEACPPHKFNMQHTFSLGFSEVGSFQNQPVCLAACSNSVCLLFDVGMSCKTAAKLIKPGAVRE